jgi:hypothetical protein
MHAAIKYQTDLASRLKGAAALSFEQKNRRAKWQMRKVHAYIRFRGAIFWIITPRLRMWSTFSRFEEMQVVFNKGERGYIYFSFSA